MPILFSLTNVVDREKLVGYFQFWLLRNGWTSVA